MNNENNTNHVIPKHYRIICSFKKKNIITFFTKIYFYISSNTSLNPRQGVLILTSFAIKEFLCFAIFSIRTRIRFSGVHNLLFFFFVFKKQPITNIMQAASSFSKTFLINKFSFFLCIISDDMEHVLPTISLKANKK